MPVLKQKTVKRYGRKTRVGLKKTALSGGSSGVQYDVVDLDTSAVLEGGFTRKTDAESAFDRITSGNGGTSDLFDGTAVGGPLDGDGLF